MVTGQSPQCALPEGFLYVGISWLYSEITLEKTHMADLPLHFAMLVPCRWCWFRLPSSMGVVSHGGCKPW